MLRRKLFKYVVHPSAEKLIMGMRMVKTFPINIKCGIHTFIHKNFRADLLFSILLGYLISHESFVK